MGHLHYIPAFTAFLLLVAVLVAPAADSVQAQEVDRSDRPAPGPVQPLELPAIQSFCLDNGLTVMLLEKHDVPLVQARLIVNAGSINDPPDQLGRASMTAGMLDKGTSEMDALEIADAFEYLGAQFAVSSDRHTTVAAVRVSSTRFEEALSLLGTVIQDPAFSEEELERLRRERLTTLIRNHDEPNVIADAQFRRSVYGPDHPYGRPHIGDLDGIVSMGRSGLEAFYESFFRPGNSALVLTGAVDRLAAERIAQQAFGEWVAGEVPSVDLHEAAPVGGRRIHLVDRPGAAQSVIRIGHTGVTRTSDDYYPLRVMNTILGGSFTSRLNQNLREDKGYTYGAWSSFAFWHEGGPFSAGAAVETEVTAPALYEFIEEFQQIRDHIPEDEVELARNFLAMRFPAGFQSVAEISENLVDIFSHDLGEDYFNRYVPTILDVTNDQTRQAALRYIDPDNVVIVIVGDRTVIEDDVRDLKLGEVNVLEITDVLGEVPTVEARE